MPDMTACAYNPRAGEVERDPQDLTGKPVWPNWQVPSSVRKPVLKNMVVSLGNIFLTLLYPHFYFALHSKYGILENACMDGATHSKELSKPHSRPCREGRFWANLLWSSVCVPPCSCLISNKPYLSSFQSPYSQFSTPHPLLRRSQHPMFQFAWCSSKWVSVSVMNEPK